MTQATLGAFGPRFGAVVEFEPYQNKPAAWRSKDMASYVRRPGKLWNKFVKVNPDEYVRQVKQVIERESAQNEEVLVISESRPLFMKLRAQLPRTKFRLQNMHENVAPLPAKALLHTYILSGPSVPQFYSTVIQSCTKAVMRFVDGQKASPKKGKQAIPELAYKIFVNDAKKQQDYSFATYQIVKIPTIGALE